MSEPQGSLIYLIRYLEGHLSASEEDAARQRLEAPDWQTAWQRLQLATVETTLPITTWEEPAVPAETLAAFLEGNLSLDEAARVEQQCWESPELLRELLSTYRFPRVEASPLEAMTSPLSQATTARLLAVFPETDRPGATRNEPMLAPPEVDVATTVWSSNAGNVVAAKPPDADLPVVVNAAKRTTRSRRRRAPAWVAYVATIVIGLGLGLGAFVLVTLSRDRTVNPQGGIVTPSEGANPSRPKEVVRPDSAPPPRQETVPPIEPELQLPGRPFDVVKEDTVPPGGTDPLPLPPRRPSPPDDPNPSPVQPYQSLAVQWEKIEGLVVAHEDDTQPWHGAMADEHRNAAAVYATLPDSWAMAKTNHGRVVLAEDTEVRLDGTRDSIQMNVTRGRVAISEVPAGQNVQLQVGPRSWIIQPTEPDTAIGFTVFARQSQLAVRRGSVTIEGTEIAAGRQVDLAADSLGTTSPISANTSWFTRPEKPSRVPAATRDALLTSRDVRADLADMWRATDHPARLLAARWSLAIASDRTLLQALSSPDDTLRLTALEWLLACQPDDPRVLFALRALARQTGDTQMARNVMSWLKSARTKTRVTRADAERMVTGLRNDNLAIRQISAFFLEAAFGKRVAFDPKAGPAARQKAAREWTALLNRAYPADRASKK